MLLAAFKVEYASRRFMHWALLSLTSAFFLGFYDICQKHALRNNAIVPVLFLSTGTCAVVWSSLLAIQALAPGCLPARAG